MKRLLLVLFFLVIVALPSLAGEKTIVFVSVLPQKYFMEQIGKDLVDVHVMVLPGASPATYEPKPSQMTALSKASIYFAIGVPFEHTWLDRIAGANPELTIIHTDQGIKKISMASHHGHDHDHETKMPDPHIWLSPLLVIPQVRQMTRAMMDADPDHQAVYSRNADEFIVRLSALHEEIMDLTAGPGQKSFIVFHPSWGYFAKTYGFEQIPMEMEGKAPTPHQLKKIIRYARKEKIKTIFIQPQFSKKSARLLAKEIHGVVATVDPLAENWEANLRHAARAFIASTE